MPTGAADVILHIPKLDPFGSHRLFGIDPFVVLDNAKDDVARQRAQNLAASETDVGRAKILETRSHELTQSVAPLHLGKLVERSYTVWREPLYKSVDVQACRGA
jgi:hypothetical protein